MAWIVHHDFIHGGRDPLPDSILIEQAKNIATQANLDFDPGDFNFSSKWLYKFDMHNNIKHTHLHGEGEAIDLMFVAIVRHCRLLWMFFMLLSSLHVVARRGVALVMVASTSAPKATTPARTKVVKATESVTTKAV